MELRCARTKRTFCSPQDGASDLQKRGGFQLRESNYDLAAEESIFSAVETQSRQTPSKTRPRHSEPRKATKNAEQFECLIIRVSEWISISLTELCRHCCCCERMPGFCVCCGVASALSERNRGLKRDRGLKSNLPRQRIS